VFRLYLGAATTLGDVAAGLRIMGQVCYRRPRVDRTRLFRQRPGAAPVVGSGGGGGGGGASGGGGGGALVVAAPVVAVAGRPALVVRYWRGRCWL